MCRLFRFNAVRQTKEKDTHSGAHKNKMLRTPAVKEKEFEGHVYWVRKVQIVPQKISLNAINSAVVPNLGYVRNLKGYARFKPNADFSNIC